MNNTKGGEIMDEMKQYVTHKDMDGYALIILGAVIGIIALVFQYLNYIGAI